MFSHDGLIRFWYVSLPEALRAVVPRVASAISDGGWTAVWSRVAAWAPPLVFVVGLFVPRSWPGTEVVHAESLSFLALAVALSMLSGTLGVALLVAGGVREALSRDVASELHAFTHEGVGHLVVWLVLGVLVVMLPQFAHVVAEAGVVRLRFLRHVDVRAIVRSVLLAMIYAGVVVLWCQAAPLLIRPAFTWSGIALPLETVTPVGAWWPWLAASAAGAALARGVLEGIVAPRRRRAADVSALTRARHASQRAGGGTWRDIHPAVRGSAAIVATTLLMAGLFTTVEEAAVASLVIGVLVLVAHQRRGGLTGSWADRVRPIPGAIRVAMAFGVGYLASSWVLASPWSGGTLRATLIGALLTLALLVVLFPSEDERLRRSHGGHVKVWR